MPGTLRTSGGDVQRAPNDFIIGPSRLILPWPFDESVKGSEDDFEVDSFDLESDYDPSQDTIGNLLLKAGDDLVDGIGVRDAIGLRRPMNPMSRNVLIRWVQEKLGHATYGLPDAIQVESLDRLPDTTHLRISEDALTLVLGASRVGTSSLFAENKVYEQWPCGAFEP